MIITTTSNLDTQPVQRYLGIVTGEVIVGANVFRDMFAQMTDFFGGRSGKYETVLARARDQAVNEMKIKATTMGGNAILAVDIDYAVVGGRGSMLMVSATGTAVFI